MNKYIIILISIIGMMLSGCKDATIAQFNALSKPHIITLYGCNGDTIQQWHSTGSVSNEEHSDGWYFEDRETGKLIETTGNIVIEIE